MSAQVPLAPEDQIKIDSWSKVIILLDYYYDLTFDSAYDPKRNALGRRHCEEMPAQKIEIIVRRYNELLEMWEKALGPNWRSYLVPD